MGLTPRPHDLLRLRAGAVPDAALPGWASASLAACPWAVVRRAPHPPGLIPVGVRGPRRRQRHAALVPDAAVLRRVPPEQLDRRGRPWLSDALAATLSAVELRLSAEVGDGVTWGPIGGVGFELATGHPVTHRDSDVDLLIRTPHRMPPDLAARLLAAFGTLPRPVDCQLETPRGGVSLAEWARTGGPVMARTWHGPELVDDPWTPA
ncbi:malonate decarboxylase holo-ACP synthase [Nonomuraea sp. MTCD27]|uniref:malonate decarboxylase holo-ACP synthase n=3 Tax=unclassified Nonomuraea TaxID=2593643 RepID=UPI0035C04848